MLMKYLLRMNDLNNSFHGGMSSFLLFNIIYAYHQYIHKADKIEYDFNLGSFLLGCLKFYTEDFNYKDLGISLRKGGYFFRKDENIDIRYNSLLCVENFLDKTHDIGKCNHKFEEVRNYFSDIYNIIVNSGNADSFISLLIK